MVGVRIALGIVATITVVPVTTRFVKRSAGDIYMLPDGEGGQ